MGSHHTIDVIIDESDDHVFNEGNQALYEALRAGLPGQFLRIQERCLSQKDKDLYKNMCNMTVRAFTWSPAIKNSISKTKNPHFLGFTGRGEEKTNERVDNRETFDFVIEAESVMSSEQWSSDHQRDKPVILAGRNQWPDPSLVGPEFRSTVEQFMLQMRHVYRKLLVQLEIGLELPAGTLENLDTADALHRLKLVRYFPDNGTSENDHVFPTTELTMDQQHQQGVGAHQDESGWLTFVREVDEAGLQVHLRNGTKWMQVALGPSFAGLNIGGETKNAYKESSKAFERGTNGLIHATLHRVQTPPPRAPARHTIVFFAGLPLGQSYAALQRIFMQSPPLAKLQQQGSENLSSKEYQAALDELKVGGKSQPDTFGSSQLMMWNRSYETAGTAWKA